MKELLNMTALAKHLGITKVRVGQLCKEKRMTPDYEINGRYFWKPSTADKLKEAFKSPGVKGKPKQLQPQKKNQATVTQEQENYNVTETVPIEPPDKENLNRDEQVQERVIMKEVKVFLEPKKFRWQCPGCGHENRKNAHEDDGSAKSELKCWACNMTIKFSDEQKVWHILNE